MRIVEAEPQLLKDILDEIKLVTTHDIPSCRVHVGHHQTLGRMVVIEGRAGDGAIVELE